jgi:hypothetical protein
VTGAAPPPPGGARFEPPAPKEPVRSGVLAVPPLHLGGGSGTSLSNALLALIAYASLGIAGSVALIRAVKYLRDNRSP